MAMFKVTAYETRRIDKIVYDADYDFEAMDKVAEMLEDGTLNINDGTIINRTLDVEEIT